MIALLYGLPLVTIPNGQSFSFQKAWIKNALQTTASAQGYGCWWFAHELAESVELYLRREWSGSAITIAELETIIKDLLLSLRFSDLATAFFLPPPPTTLSLLELAKEAGEGYELLFFQLLKKRLEKVAQSSTEQLEVYGLDASLRQLFHRKRLGRKETKGQIINYIRDCGIASSSETKRSPSRSLKIRII
ncbi:MAG: hypothetical protein NT164_05730 [Verrucomicrobiae bacterium]|nr:hypothetical protein [Verrucomicrobiae bacterium]